MGKWRVFGSYIDNSHIFPGPPHALEEEALVALPLSQWGTQLCASHSAQHYLVTAAAALRLSETKSSQSQLSLLLNSSLFSVMHFLTGENPQGRKVKLNICSISLTCKWDYLTLAAAAIIIIIIIIIITITIITIIICNDMCYYYTFILIISQL